jgi:hypothetical protein
MGNETIIANRDELTQKRVRLNPASLANDDISLDFDEGADEAIISDRTAIKVHRLDYGDTAAKCDVDDARLAQIEFRGWIFHEL